MKKNNTLFKELGLMALLALVLTLTVKVFVLDPPTQHVSEETLTTINTTQLAPVKEQSLKSETTKVLKNFTMPEHRSLLILGVISDNAVRAANRIYELNQESTTLPIVVELTSPGGSVISGATLIAAIQVSKAPVYTVCHILCASMAAMIHQYGHKRYQVDRSILMFHPASGGAQGEIDKMFSMMGTIKRFVDKMNLEVATRANMTPDDFRKLWSVELWMDAEDAVEKHFTDAIVNTNANANYFEVFQSETNLPDGVNLIMPNYKNYEFLFSKANN